MDEPNTYLQERQSLIRGEHSDAEHYDKWLLTLSGGAFAISITFIRYIAPDPSGGSIAFLVIAWVSFLLSILATMTSLQCSQAAFQRQREILDALQSNPNACQENWRATCVKALNWLSLGLFGLGAIMLAVFSTLNL